MDQQPITGLLKSFEQIKQVEDNWEYRSARELQPLLGYVQRRNFQGAIERAKVSCKEAGNDENLHFADVSKTQNSRNQYWDIHGPSIDDYHLSRYACYLIAQNGDPRKQEIAFAQAYFAVQTRKQELIEQKMQEIERLRARKKTNHDRKRVPRISVWKMSRWYWYRKD